jgi:hypothetical protein
MSGFFSNLKNTINKTFKKNIETLPVLEKKPSKLKSVDHKDQGEYGTCASHAISRSICRTFQVLTIIDGPSVEIFYTLIYLMIQKLFDIDCNEGIDIQLIPSIINKILKTFDDYINESEDPNSDLDNYKYSDIKCEYKINGSNELCNISNEPILKDLKQDQLSQFKSKFKILYKIKDALTIRKCIYNYNINEPNYPNYMIRDLLKKKLQPCICFNYSIGGHVVVLQSWGIEYDEKGKKDESKLTVFCYKNTWQEEYKKCYDDINLLSDDTNTNPILFFCLDYNFEIIKNNDKKLGKEIKTRRKEYYDTVSSMYKEEEIKYLNNGVYKGKIKNGKPEGQGKLEYYNGHVYEGEFKDGDPYGKGKGKKVYYSSVYEGEFKDGTPEGQGKMIYKNGDIYEGEFKESDIYGSIEGKGKMIYINGDIYEGEFKDGTPEGQGKMTYKNGEIYEGEFNDGEPQEKRNETKHSGGKKIKAKKRKSNKRKTKKIYKK